MVTSITGVHMSTRAVPRRLNSAERGTTTNFEFVTQENLSVGITMPTEAGNERARVEGYRERARRLAKTTAGMTWTSIAACITHALSPQPVLGDPQVDDYSSP